MLVRKRWQRMYRFPTGHRWGRLTFMGRTESRLRENGKRFMYYECRCDCGQIGFFPAQNVRNGHTQSCGCYRKEKQRTEPRTHGESHSRLYVVRCSIIARCENPNEPAYKHYGGRGITICPEWRQSYTAFRDWAIGSGYRHGLTIDRINNNDGYSPNNCRWIPQSEQSLNTRKTRYVTAFGETKPLILWIRDPRTAVSHNTLRKRLAEGWLPERAIVTEGRHDGKYDDLI